MNTSTRKTFFVTWYIYTYIGKFGGLEQKLIKTHEKQSWSRGKKTVSNQNVEYSDLLSIALSNTALVPNFSSRFYTHFLPFCRPCPSKLVCSLEIQKLPSGRVIKSTKVRECLQQGLSRKQKCRGFGEGRVEGSTNIALTSALFPTTKFPCFKTKVTNCSPSKTL